MTAAIHADFLNLLNTSRYASYLRVIEHVRSRCRHPRRTPEATTEADGKDPGEAMGLLLDEIHKGTTGDDSSIVVRQAQQRYDRVSAVWARARLWRAGTSHGTPLFQTMWSEV
jgi:hypothetical protein